MLTRTVTATALVLLATLGGILFHSARLSIAQAPPVSSGDDPHYTPDGSLIMPQNYREWIFLTAGLDMSYNPPKGTPPDQHVFQNVFANPGSYHSFLETGTWPNKTTLITEVRGADNPVSINKQGHTQSGVIVTTEIHVKDHNKWSFYEMQGGLPTAKYIPPPADCYACHEAHAAVDTTFVQYYPILLPIAEQHGTISPNYKPDPPTAH